MKELFPYYSRNHLTRRFLFRIKRPRPGGNAKEGKGRAEQARARGEKPDNSVVAMVWRGDFFSFPKDSQQKTCIILEQMMCFLTYRIIQKQLISGFTYFCCFLFVCLFCLIWFCFKSRSKGVGFLLALLLLLLLLCEKPKKCIHGRDISEWTKRKGKGQHTPLASLSTSTTWRKWGVIKERVRDRERELCQSETQHPIQAAVLS